MEDPQGKLNEEQINAVQDQLKQHVAMMQAMQQQQAQQMAQQQMFQNMQSSVGGGPTQATSPGQENTYGQVF
jgi:hypothetical protein